MGAQVSKLGAKLQGAQRQALPQPNGDSSQQEALPDGVRVSTAWGADEAQPNAPPSTQLGDDGDVTMFHQDDMFGSVEIVYPTTVADPSGADETGAVPSAAGPKFMRTKTYRIASSRIPWQRRWKMMQLKMQKKKRLTLGTEASIESFPSEHDNADAEDHMPQAGAVDMHALHAGKVVSQDGIMLSPNLRKPVGSKDTYWKAIPDPLPVPLKAIPGGTHVPVSSSTMPGVPTTPTSPHPETPQLDTRGSSEPQSWSVLLSQDMSNAGETSGDLSAAISLKTSPSTRHSTLSRGSKLPGPPVVQEVTVHTQDSAYLSTAQLMVLGRLFDTHQALHVTTLYRGLPPASNAVILQCQITRQEGEAPAEPDVVLVHLTDDPAAAEVMVDLLRTLADSDMLSGRIPTVLRMAEHESPDMVWRGVCMDVGAGSDPEDPSPAAPSRVWTLQEVYAWELESLRELPPDMTEATALTPRGGQAAAPPPLRTAAALSELFGAHGSLSRWAAEACEPTYRDLFDFYMLEKELDAAVGCESNALPEKSLLREQPQWHADLKEVMDILMDATADEAGGLAWVKGWAPLGCPAHGALHAGHVVVTPLGEVQLLAITGNTQHMLADFARLEAALLWECTPLPISFEELRKASPEQASVWLGVPEPLATAVVKFCRSNAVVEAPLREAETLWQDFLAGQVPSVWRKRLLMRLNASQQRCWSYLLQAIRLSDALVNIHPHHELSPMEWSGAELLPPDLRFAFDRVCQLRRAAAHTINKLLKPEHPLDNHIICLWALYTCFRLTQQIIHVVYEKKDAKWVKSVTAHPIDSPDKMSFVKADGTLELGSRIWLDLKGKWIPVTITMRNPITGLYAVNDEPRAVLDLDKELWVPMPPVDYMDNLFGEEEDEGNFFSVGPSVSQAYQAEPIATNVPEDVKQEMNSTQAAHAALDIDGKELYQEINAVTRNALEEASKKGVSKLLSKIGSRVSQHSTGGGSVVSALSQTPKSPKLSISTPSFMEHKSPKKGFVKSLTRAFTRAGRGGAVDEDASPFAPPAYVKDGPYCSISTHIQTETSVGQKIRMFRRYRRQGFVELDIILGSVKVARAKFRPLIVVIKKTKKGKKKPPPDPNGRRVINTATRGPGTRLLFVMLGCQDSVPGVKGRNNLIYMTPEALEQWESGERDWCVREAYVLEPGDDDADAGSVYSDEEDEMDEDDEDDAEQMEMNAEAHDLFYLYRTGRRVSILQKDSGNWKAGTFMGLDPQDGRFRVRYDGDPLTLTQLAPVLNPNNHRMLTSMETLDVGEELMVCKGPSEWVDSIVIEPPQRSNVYRYRLELLPEGEEAEVSHGDNTQVLVDLNEHNWATLSVSKVEFEKHVEKYKKEVTDDLLSFIDPFTVKPVMVHSTKDGAESLLKEPVQKALPSVNAVVVNLEKLEQLWKWDEFEIKVMCNRRLDAGGDIQVKEIFDVVEPTVDADNVPFDPANLYASSIQRHQSLHFSRRCLAVAPVYGGERRSFVENVYMRCATDPDTEYIPLLVDGRTLAHEVVRSKRYLNAPNQSLLLSYISLKYDNNWDVHSLLEYALRMKRVLVLLDGVDEGGVEEENIIVEWFLKFADAGHRLLMTCAPRGMDLNAHSAAFDDLVWVLPLTAEQQDEMAGTLVKDTGKRLQLLPHRRFSHSIQFHRTLSEHPALLQMLAASHLRHGNLPHGAWPMCTQVAEDAVAGCLDDNEEAMLHLNNLLERIAYKNQLEQTWDITNDSMSWISGEAFDKPPLKDDENPMLEAWQALVTLTQQGRLALVQFVCADESEPLVAGGDFLLRFAHPLFQEYYAAKHFMSLVRTQAAGDVPADTAELDYPTDRLPEFEDLMELPWWLEVMKLSDEAEDTFYDILVAQYLYSTQLRFNARQMANPCAQHLLCRIVERATVITELEIVGEVDSEERIVIDDAQSLTSRLAPAIAATRNAHLTSMHLTACGINHVGASILAESVACSTITELGLAYNFIGPEGMCALAEAFQAWPEHLQLLILTGNGIGGFGSSSEANSEDESGMKAMGEALKVMQSLAHLDLSSNGIGRKGCLHLAEGIRENRSLETVSISRAKLPVGQLRRDDLKSLDLRDRDLGPEDLVIVSCIISSTTTLTELCLSGNCVNGRQAESDDEKLHGLAALGEALKDHMHLTHLDLSSNRIGPQGLSALLGVPLYRMVRSEFWIGKGLASGYDTMTELLYNTKFRDAVSRKKAAHKGVVNMLSGMLGGDSKGDGDETAQQAVALENYSFFGTDGEGGTGDLEEKEREVYLDVLQARIARGLKSLNLANNFLGSLGAKIVATLLKPKEGASTRYRCVIRTLFLQENKMGPEGVKALVQALQPDEDKTKPWLTNTSLQLLDVSANELNGLTCTAAEGAVTALAHLIKVNKHIQELYMAQNGFTAQHAELLADALAPEAVTNALVVVGEDAAPLPANLEDKTSLLVLQAFQERLPVKDLLNQAVYTLDMPALTFEDAVLLKRLLAYNHSMSLMNLPGPIQFPIRQIRSREITEIIIMDANLQPAHLVVIAALLSSSVPAVHTCLLPGNALGGYAQHAGSTAVEDAGAMRALGEALQVNRSLTVLDLSNNGIGPKGLAYLAQGLACNKALEMLNLAENQIANINEQGFGYFDGVGLQELFAVVFPKSFDGDYNTTLSAVDLSNNAISSEGAHLFSEAYKQRCAIPGLAQLDLSHNRMGVQGLRHLAEGFSTELEFPDREQRLALLNLAGNNFAANGQDHSALYEFADAVRCMRHITVLNLIANGIEDVDTIAELFKNHEGLQSVCGFSTRETTLNFSQMDLHLGDVAVVTAEIAFNNVAETVDVSSNELNSGHAALLLRAFTADNGLGAYNTTAATLVLADNHIGGPPYVAGAPVFEDGKPVEHTGGMLAVAEMLQSNTTIRSLSLNQNCIGPRGVELLVKALRENTGVAMLDLGANLLGPDGCAALAPIFVPDRFERKFNSTLLALNLSSNSLYHRIYMDAAGNHQLSEDCSGIQTLTAALFRPYANGLRDTHATLVLNLQLNGQSDEAMLALQFASNENPTLRCLTDMKLAPKPKAESEQMSPERLEFTN